MMQYKNSPLIQWFDVQSSYRDENYFFFPVLAGGMFISATKLGILTLKLTQFLNTDK